MKTPALFNIVCRSVLFAGVVVNAAKGATPNLIDVDLDGGIAPTGKVGFAATGHTAADYWNWYTRNDGFGGYLTFGVLGSLKTVEGAATTVGMTIANAPGAFGFGSSDPMYNGYVYPFDGGNVTITVTNLAAGQYDFYAYTHDGNSEVTVGSVSYGIKHTFDYPPSNPPVWTAGLQYSLFSNVLVGAGQDLVLTERPGTGGYAVISGFQIQAAPEPATGTMLGCGLAGWLFWNRKRCAARLQNIK